MTDVLNRAVHSHPLRRQAARLRIRLNVVDATAGDAIAIVAEIPAHLNN
jgi:hypothetical protein